MTGFNNTPDMHNSIRKVAKQLTTLSQQWTNIPTNSNSLLQMAQFIIFALETPRRLNCRGDCRYDEKEKNIFWGEF